MNKKSSLNFKVVAFWFAIAAITAIFLFVFITNLLKVRVFNSMDDIERADLLLVNDEITKQSGTYYVYIYSLESEKNLEKRQELEPSILNYFTWVSLNNGKYKIYGYNVDDYSMDYISGTVYKYLGTLNPNIKANDAPMLVKVVNGSISTVYTTINKIESELQSQMK
jgi:hypothetical protein